MYESEEGNIKMGLIGMVYKGMDSIQIADYGVQKLVFWIRGWMIVSFWKKKKYRSTNPGDWIGKACHFYVDIPRPL